MTGTDSAVMEGLEDIADTAEPCGDCGIAPDPSRPVAWSPAYGLHLCGSCRSRRVAVELSATERANSAARFAARMAAKQK